MEIKTTTVKSDVQFKASSLKAIGIDIEKLPTFPEALRAKREADIVSEQGIGLFLSNPVQWVLKELELRNSKENSKVFITLDAFNYGYILGIRAERARRKGVK